MSFPFDNFCVQLNDDAEKNVGRIHMHRVQLNI